jgi:hypothetical protein
MNMSKLRLVFLSALVALLSWEYATAQQSDEVRYGTGGGASQTENRVNVGGSYGGFFGGHASTAQEGMARGMADVIRSRGQASVDLARAATESERARRAYLENRNFAISSYVENRAIRDEFRARESAARKEKMLAYVKTQRLQPLTESEFYEPTGEVRWPIGLLHPHCETGRKEVEALLAQRALNGSLTAEQYIRLTKLLRDWISHVPDHKGDFSSTDTSAAISFLRRLEMLLRSDHG